ncbi:hypothetical protein [Stygiolobus caldivivus]|uniref:PIN domain-containing protein n=1 Tax=Stygiolobus caldivivus TaxID=2824673 RepID=A0A8D5U5E3_9CREN|nr:hypothetical protein [Stygiolobus caldivivus]BCU69806.1 hypothetical protein KN1_11030 [Stygiolobus caldivivus]
MILATLGSNKLVTTVDAIMTEIFTGVRPDKVLVLSEEPRIVELGEVFKAFGLDPQTEVKALGVGVKEWREKLKEIDIDVADITPGRKYMAVSVLNYSNAKEVRYAYLREEGEGYRVFGYVPLKEITVYNVRTGEVVPFEPPKTVNGLPKKAEIGVESLRALYNLYSQLGDVDYDEIGDEDKDRMCKFRAGFLKFKEEEEVRKLVSQGYFLLADTNVYITLGERLGRLCWNKELGFRLLASRSTYGELLNYTKTTQKGEDPKFFLGMSAYRHIHRQPPVGQVGGSDVKFIEEAKALKKEIPDPLAVITRDQGVKRSADSQGVKAVLLSETKKGEGDIGQLLFCESFYRDVEIRVNGELFAKVLKSKFPEERKVEVEVMKAEYNYPYVLSKLEEVLRGKDS